MKNKELEKNITKLYAMVTLNNMGALACFTVLAIVFRHWWIALLSVLFYKSFKIDFDTNKKGDK